MPEPSASTRGQLLNETHEPRDNADNRYSGVGAVGLGFMTGNYDYDEDEDEIPSIPTRSDRANSTDSSTSHRAAHQALPNALIPSRPNLTVAKSIPPQGLQPPLGNGQPSTIIARVQASSNRVPMSSSMQPRAIRNPQVNFVPKAPAPLSIPIPQPVAPPLTSPGMQPHPLQPPSTPIAPAFARPAKSNRASMLKFAENAILRGNKEETLLTRNSPRGAEFWRRFSVVVKDEDVIKSGGRSSWFTQNQNRASRMSKCVWVMSIMILLAIGAAVGLGWFFTHNNPASGPKSLGGSANNTSDAVSSSTLALGSSSVILHTVTGDLPPSTTPPVPFATASATPAKRYNFDPAVARRRVTKRRKF